MRLQLVNRWGDAASLTAHYAMVEPKMSYKEIIDIDWNKFDGIQEIAEAADGMAKGEHEGS